MNNPQFGSLVHRIIGDPQKWQNTSVDMLHTISDEALAQKISANSLDIQIGLDIIARLASRDEVLSAFSTFLEDSRFGLIILDEHFKHIYNNSKAEITLTAIKSKKHPHLISEELRERIQSNSAILSSKSLLPLTFPQNDSATIYLKETSNNSDGHKKTFYVLLIPTANNNVITLHKDLSNLYKLTQKEEGVLSGIIAGKGIQEISDSLSVSKNTIKSQLKSIFFKTDTNSQTAVISLFLNHEIQLLETYFEFKIPSCSGNNIVEKDHYIFLSNNAQLCYRDYGPKDGRPLIVMHSGFGCRLQVPNNYAEICERLNRRIIIPDRPGIGQSDLFEGYPHNWNQYFNEFVDQLAISEFDLIGNSLGAAFALDYTCANPERVNKLIFTNPLFLNNPEEKKHLGTYLYPAARLISVSEKIASELYLVWLKSMTLNVDKHLFESLKNNMGEKEVKYILDSNFVRPILQNFTEASRLTHEGSVLELIYALTPKKYDYDKLKSPVEIWYGDGSSNIYTTKSVEAICGPIQNKTMHFKEGYGNEIYYILFEEMIA